MAKYSLFVEFSDRRGGGATPALPGIPSKSENAYTNQKEISIEIRRDGGRGLENPFFPSLLNFWILTRPDTCMMT